MIILIICLYIALTIFVGVRASKNSDNASYHGAALGLVYSVAASVGEWLGGTSTTGVSEYGYEYGISGAWYTIANGIGVIILAVFFAELYRKTNEITIPGIIGKYVGEKAQHVSSILLIFVMLVIGTSQMVSMGSLGHSLLNIDYTLAIIIMGAGVIVYTLMGGMQAVSKTNLLHVIAMYFGMILAVLVVVKDIGGSTVVKNTLPDSFYSPTAIGMPKISSWIIASVLGACTAQAGVQPLLAAKDVKTAKKSAIVTAIIVAPFGLFTAYLGMCARVKYPNLTDAKSALPTLMMGMNPIVGGIVMSAILAAVLSTLGPLMLSSATMFTHDIYKKNINKEADDFELLRISRIATGLSGIICIVLAIFLYDSTRILDFVYFAYTIRGSLFIVLLFGIYWKKTTENGACRAMILTALVSLVWVVYKTARGSYPIHPEFNETYAALITATLATYFFSKVESSKIKSN